MTGQKCHELHSIQIKDDTLSQKKNNDEKKTTTQNQMLPELKKTRKNERLPAGHA
jgi:hypothetical protein